MKHYAMILAVFAIFIPAGCCKKKQFIGTETLSFQKKMITVDGNDFMSFVRVPKGAFIRGACNFTSDAGPSSEVELDEYWIGQYEVTNVQFAEFVQQTGYVTHAETFDSSRYIHGCGLGACWKYPTGVLDRVTYADKHPDWPVVHVTWNDAMEFCKWLSAKTGCVIQLPSEAQWEKAARGTDERFYPWGFFLDIDHVNEYCNIANERAFTDEQKMRGDRRPFLVSVYDCKKGVSPYGCYHMIGNVEEWCLDFYSPTFYKDSGDIVNTKVALQGTAQLRSVRGDCWFQITSIPPFLFDRNATIEEDADDTKGFRVVMIPTPAAEAEGKK